MKINNREGENIPFLKIRATVALRKRGQQFREKAARHKQCTTLF